MSLGIVTERVMQHPVAAAKAFDRLEGALNLTLPGSDFHQRYLEAEEIGLGLVVGSGDVPADTYNPLNPLTHSRLAFRGSNLQLRPQAWEPQPRDMELLGGEVPAELGRFTSFALAKINNMTFSKGSWSYSPESIAIAPGRVGFAGGRWEGGAMIAVSGLWELHDHVMTRIYVDEFELERDPHEPRRTVDELAGEIADVLERVKALHKPYRAEDIDRSKMDILLGDALALLTTT